MRRITVFCLILALILLGLTGLAAAQNVSIQLTPQSLPIQIPATGGSFDYTISATNNGTTAQRAAIWCMITLPDSSVYGPVLGPVRIALSPGQTIERQRIQNIPAGFPAGNYSFNAHIGVYPDTVWDSDSFPFEKTLAGSELWVARYNGPGNGDDVDSSIAVDSVGNVYVTGRSYGSGTYYDYATIKYNSAGVEEWVARYNGPGNGDDRAYSLAVDEGGNVYMTGRSIGSGTYYDYATIKYNSAGGEQWVARYNGPGNGWDGALSIAVDGDGNVYAAGRSEESGNDFDYTTIKYNSAGVEQWVARYNGPANTSDGANSIAVDAGGNVYVTGYNYGIGTHYDYATIKYDSAGVEQWVARYNGPVNSNDYANRIAVDGDGNVFVTGYSDGSGSYIYDYATIKYDSAGAEQWVARYDGPGNYQDYAYGIAIDGGGNVFVTGYSYGSHTGYDYATIKYNSAGIQQWVARYNGQTSSADYAYSLALDGTGNVYVTGGSLGDYTTIKYSGGNVDNWMPVEATVLGQSAWGGPQEFALHQNYPNPFNAATVLSYQLPVASSVRLKVYDTAGRSVETLVDGWRSAGTHELTFDASDLPSGMYVYRIQAGDWTDSGKMVLLK